MAGRPIKRRIDYAGWSADMFDSDPKIDDLLDAQGWLGFAVYFYLCQKAYGSEGYFYRWSYANATTTARKMGGGIRSETVINTVNACLRIGLYDKRLFAEKVLTSRGIQKRYWAAITAMRNGPRKLIIPEFWLLNEEEAPGCIEYMQNSDLSASNGNYTSLNGNLTHRKEKKRKEIIRKETDCDCPDSEIDEAMELNLAISKIEAAAEGIGLPVSPKHLEMINLLIADYGVDWALEAIEITATHAGRITWGYVKGILRNWREKGKDAPKPGEKPETSGKQWIV